MAVIKITRDNYKAAKPSIFGICRDIVNRAKKEAVAGEKTDIVLEGFAQEQAKAVQYILNMAYFMALGKDPEACRRMGPAQGTILSQKAMKFERPEGCHDDLAPSVERKVSLVLGELGTLAVTGNLQEKRHTISLPYFSPSVVSFSITMEQVIAKYQGYFADVGGRSASVPPCAEIGSDRTPYRVFSFQNLEALEMGLELISSISHAHGFAKPEDIWTVKQGVDLGSGGKYPSILLREEAYQAIKANEKSISPPPF